MPCRHLKGKTMPYALSPALKTELGTALALYYEEAFDAGTHAALDRIAQAGMGTITGYLDRANDTYANLKRKSKDKFGVAFKGQLKLELNRMFANKNDIASIMVGLGEKALVALAEKIPVPLLSTVVAKGITLAAGEAKATLHTQATAEADTALNAKAGIEVSRFFTDDNEAAELVKKSLEQYKDVCKYITALPSTISTFDDAVTFPMATFKIQKAASALNVALTQINDYLTAMRSRTEAISTVVTGYKRTVREKMPDAAEDVLQKGYADAYLAGKTDIGRNKYKAPLAPVLKKPEGNLTGGATLLASYLAHALAQGYYDAGNEMMAARPRSNAVDMSMTRPRSNAIIR
ncbi:hypothetical protein [Janthinobacterium aquaticum]|uniref:hypothetical protein n=1 Tax=Janthinobacterium sp. FT58W TaxID=2654254 RepID=UPI0012642DA3|nr:hypothetical protein [Janthinobacterium sp. FT58W]KAB8044229.1 hypothetical protein GCM43_03165 [Janthinobacterium sp. FT58W]